MCFQKEARDAKDGLCNIPEAIKGAEIKARDLVIEPTSRAIAEQVILNYEWLGTLPSTCNAYYGAFYEGWCAGVCCFLVGGGSIGGMQFAKTMGVDISEMAYLVRGACVHWAPHNANSLLVARSCALLPRRIKVVFAYSDDEAGEIGTIYQACNWTYIGKSPEPRRLQAVSPAGRVFDEKQVRDLAKSSNTTQEYILDCLIEQGWSFRMASSKHRYIWTRGKDRSLINRVNELRMPYPKRK